MESSVAKFVVVPCRLDDEEKIIPTAPPHGYHHILKIHDDGSYSLLATVFHSVMEIDLMDIAKIVANGELIETNPEFYRQKETRDAKEETL